jgi:hypothetical protein
MVRELPPSCQVQVPSSHGVSNLIAAPPSASSYGSEPEGLLVVSSTATPSYVTGWLPPKTTQLPFATEKPPAQNVLEDTDMGVASLVRRS